MMRNHLFLALPLHFIEWRLDAARGVAVQRAGQRCQFAQQTAR